MRIVFAGSGTFGLPSLCALRDGGQEVALVVTAPDRPAGRGQVVRPGPVKRFARDEGLEVLETDTVNAPSVVRRIRDARPDLLLVIAFGRKIGPLLLALPRYGAVNLHGSLLPKYRGAAPVNWALIRGETETGLSVIRMTDQIDAGDILGQRATPVDPDETAGELHERLARLGSRLVTEVVRELVLEEVEPRRQNETQATFAPRLKKRDGAIDWDRPAPDVHNHIRGVTPWPGAFTYLPGKRDKSPLRIVVNRTTLPEETPQGGKPGEMVAASEAGLDVAAARGSVRLLEVTPAGKRTMTAADFLHGYPVRAGIRFLSSAKGALA